jgi:DNA mismatch repair protein MutS2
MSQSLLRSYRALEWEKLKECLALEAETHWARELSLAIEPANETLVVAQLLDETQEAVSLLQANTPLSFNNLPELREILARLAAGACLSPAEFLHLYTVLVVARRVRGGLSLLDSKDFPQLTKFVGNLHALESLASAIDTAIDETGEVKDSASPQLHQLRREVRTIDHKIKDELNKLIHSASVSKILQEPIYTQRNGRYVLPVNANSRTSLVGIVHDSSSSGLTVYIEPAKVVELGNDMRMKENAIEHEIVRILTELSAQAHLDLEKIKTSYSTLIELDCIFARARLSQKYKGERPDISMSGQLDLRKARHPLLALQMYGKSVVGNDIILDAKVKTIIVTGPNTGGKTVLLKTAGLLALMLKVGMLLPVEPGSTAVIFTDVYADIGDEQSIEQSLSTFSSHMKNIIEIVNNARSGSLVIMDEIGAGTDPREGAALARAILNHLNESGAYTISATHFGELKTLAYLQEGFVNASLEFDEATLSPTFRLRIGIPGGSKATTIARRLGLNENVVAEAETLMQAQDQDVQQTIEKLEAKLEEIAALEKDLSDSQARAKAKEQLAESKLSEVTVAQEKLHGKMVSEMESEFKQAREQLRKLISDLQKQPSLQKAEKFKTEMEEVRKDLNWLAEPKEATSPDKLTIGALVNITSLNRQARVEQLPPDYLENPKGQATVQAGSLRLKVAVGDLQFVAREKAKIQAKVEQKKQVPVSARNKHDVVENVFVRTMLNTLDLRGKRVDEALQMLDRFLDTCVMQSISPAMIIHGHGTGAVKSATRDYLRECSFISKFRPGELYEGGDGVTVVEIN